jgi:hypothetical protein
MITPQSQPGDDALLDVVQFCHQFGKQGLAGLVKEGPGKLFRKV